MLCVFTPAKLKSLLDCNGNQRGAGGIPLGGWGWVPLGVVCTPCPSTADPPGYQCKQAFLIYLPYLYSNKHSLAFCEPKLTLYYCGQKFNQLAFQIVLVMYLFYCVRFDIINNRVTFILENNFAIWVTKGREETMGDSCYTID